MASQSPMQGQPIIRDFIHIPNWGGGLVDPPPPIFSRRQDRSTPQTKSEGGNTLVPAQCKSPGAASAVGHVFATSLAPANPH